MTSLRRIFSHPAAPGLTLLAAAAAAIVCANTGAAGAYAGLLAFELGGHVGPLHLEKPLILWINDGLMAIFFLLIGLEVKRELIHGALRDPSQRVLPAVAAVGGMVVPAAVYVAATWGDPRKNRRSLR